MKKGKSRKSERNKKQAPMDYDCCYKGIAAVISAVVAGMFNKGKCLEDTGRKLLVNSTWIIFSWRV